MSDYGDHSEKEGLGGLGEINGDTDFLDGLVGEALKNLKGAEINIKVDLKVRYLDKLITYLNLSKDFAENSDKGVKRRIKKVCNSIEKDLNIL
ncbi:MAG: hypothetical protein ACOCT9_00285 [archaeon]